LQKFTTSSTFGFVVSFSISVPFCNEFFFQQSNKIGCPNASNLGQSIVIQFKQPHRAQAM
jgi:hypothetical protein